MQERFPYGGQAVLEGVMIRGKRYMGLAVRRPGGGIYTHCRPLPTFATGRWRRIPLIRGVLALAETLVLGAQALNRSAVVAAEVPGASPDDPPEEPPKWLFALSMGIALIAGLLIFLLTPWLLSRFIEVGVGSDFLANVVEGVIRLVLLIGYIWLIGRMRDIQRVFAYHGAEHMTIHASEHGEPMDAEHIRRYPKAHPRCGTAFLLTVALVSVFVYTLMGRHGVVFDATLRILSTPLIAALAYEAIRFSGFHRDNAIVRVLSLPNLWLQALTTRVPDDQMIEVAVTALHVTVAADRSADAGAPVVESDGRAALHAYDPRPQAEAEPQPSRPEDDAPLR